MQWGRLSNPVKSRKVQVAVATIITAYLAEWGIETSESTVLAIIVMGAADIIGTAVEDAGQKAKTIVIPDKPGNNGTTAQN